MTDTEYSHDAWLSSQGQNVQRIEGDERALAAIRQATRDHYGADDVTDDAPVFFWMGGHVKGLGTKMYQIPADASRRYLEIRDFPQLPLAVWPSDDGETRRQELMAVSAPADGDPVGIREVMNRTRLFHEVTDGSFPFDGELRWFVNGLHVIGEGDDPVVYQVPMARVEELVVPRAAPTLPWIKSPPAVA